MLIRALFFLLGDVLIQQLPQLPPLPYLSAGGVLLVVCIWRHHWLWMAFLFGMVWTTLCGMNRLAHRLPTALEAQEVRVDGMVFDLAKITHRHSRFDFQVQQASAAIPAKIRLTWYDTPQKIKAGQHWHLCVKLKRPHSLANPGSFDYATWLFSEDIGAIGSVTNAAQAYLLAESSPYTLKSWRQTLSDQLDSLLKNTPRRGIIKALSLGDGNDIPPSQWKIFRRTGTIHLIVISGSHISLVAGFVFFLSRALWIKTGILRLAPQTFAAVLSLLAGVLYAGLAGFSLPTQRAMLMVATVMLSLIFQRHITFPVLLSRVLWLILLFDPFAVLAIGFWLSFTSVVFIIYCTAGRLGRLPYLFPVVGIHGVMAVALAPLLLFSFQQVPLISPLANFIAVPVVEFLAVPLLLLTLVVLFPTPAFAGIILTAVDKILLGLYTLLEKLAQPEWGIFHHAQPPLWAVLLAMLGVFLLFAPQGIPARWLSLVLCIPLFSPPRDKLQSGEFIVTLLDVGQGLATVVQTPQHLLIFDTGAKSSADFDMGTAVVLPFLYSLDVQTIDRVIISHGDNDHIGGLASLIAEMPIHRIDSSVPEKISHPTVQPCLAGQHWTWDDIQFRVLSPNKHPFDSDNNNSCVLKIASRYGHILLTGDIEAEAENELIHHAKTDLSSDILIAPHHGSKTSSTLPFLQQINPQWILIPAAYKNRYHFPHSEVVQRYQQQRIPWLMTGTEGAITVRFTREKIRITTYRHDNIRYWHTK